jgi:FkbM family methyltransferase
MRRAFEPQSVTRDRADHEHLRGVLAAILDPDSNCVDVGAHEGAVLEDIVRLAPRGHHIAYEPLTEFARRLAERFPRVEVRARALADHAGQAAFAHVLTRPGWSGLLTKSNSGAEQVESITVPVEKLDDALPPSFIPRFIKIDVEGAEEQVFRGALETIRRHRPVIAFEHGVGAADRYGTKPDTIHDMLTDDCGLTIFDFIGHGPYTRKQFGHAFHYGERVNFLARPYEQASDG